MVVSAKCIVFPNVVHTFISIHVRTCFRSHFGSSWRFSRHLVTTALGVTDERQWLQRRRKQISATPRACLVPGTRSPSSRNPLERRMNLSGLVAIAGDGQAPSARTSAWPRRDIRMTNGTLISSLRIAPRVTSVMDHAISAVVSIWLRRLHGKTATR